MPPPAVATYVINMDSATDRLAKMDAQMRRQGIPYTRFPAIDGRAMSAAQKQAVTDPGVGIIQPTPSMIGCGASHRAVWHDMLAKGHGLALVLEDDAVLCSNFMHRVKEALAAVPHAFDVLVLGSFLLSDANRDYPWALDIAGAFLATRDDTWTSTVGSTTVFVPELFAGTHCYIVSAAGAAKLLRIIPKVKTHVDMEMNHPDIHVYAASPDLALQGDMSTSSIASFDFPKVLLPFLEWKDRKGVSAAYYLNSPIGQVAGCRINSWAMLFLAIGLLAPSSTWPYVAGFLGAEVLANGPQLTYNALVPPCAYVLGFSIRRQLFSMR
jgi:GR25 family glycosyltransferase involved in LPS biosynthesis